MRVGFMPYLFGVVVALYAAIAILSGAALIAECLRKEEGKRERHWYSLP
jgi:hypothetical protein